MTFWRLIILLSFLGVGYHFLQYDPTIVKIESAIKSLLKFEGTRYSAGNLIKSEPVQRSIRSHKIQHRNYDLMPQATISMRGRVLGVKEYWLDKEAEIAPFDFVLGWKEMSNQQYVDKISFSQGLRFHAFDYDSIGINVKTVSNNSANMHIIPANSDVERIVERVKEGDIIAMVGILVDVNAPKGWTWQTSLKRTDLGKGANEIVYVKDIAIVTHNYPRVK